jgi:Protein of unknown function (DUF1573)
MKKWLFLMAIILTGATGFAQQASSAADFAVAEFTSQNHDFGKIEQGVPVTHEFTFVNKGKVPMIITNVQASCGCTTPDWSRQPVEPGGQGFIKATFNAASVGGFTKSVTITANTETGYIQLMIRGEVIGGPQQ